MRIKLFTLTLLFIASFQLSVFAGGPLIVEGGMAITYGIRPFLYRYDKGSLGKLSNSEVIAIIESLYMHWETVPTTTIKFKRDTPGLLDFDVTASNYKPILDDETTLLGYTPVVFDTDGSLLNAFLGQGAGSKVLGLSGPRRANSGPLANQIAESQAIFNGKFINGIDSPPNDPESSIDALKGTIIHETGHGIGLDHAQINVEAKEAGSSQEIRDDVPLMFPIAVNDLFIIRRDDASIVSYLYPNDPELTKFGKIEGKVFRKDGKTPVLGANIIARNINDPKLEAISCVSDFLTRGNGEYILFGIPPGSYTIELEPIDLEFVEGSGVGPYTKSLTDLSFQNPVPKGFYTGPDLPITDDPNMALIISVSASQTISDANIIASTTFDPNSSSGVTPVINEIEPNNSDSTAQVITLPVIITGNSAKSDDGDLKLTTNEGSELIINDVFKFTLTENSSINALLTNESDSPNNDLDLVLFDESASMIIDTSSQTGNTDELISRSLDAGTYLLGIGAFSGSSPYKLSVSAQAEGGAPILSITGKDTILLQATGMNKVSLNVNAFNFVQTNKCEVFSSNDSLVRIKPKKFSLSQTKTKKIVKVKVPLAQALGLISTNTTETVTLNIVCDNGASEEFDLTLTPSTEGFVRKDSTWQISRIKK